MHTNKQSTGFGFSWFVSLILLVALIVVVATHLGEAKQFALLVEYVKPQWFVFALLLQIGTYSCAGGIWYTVAKSAGHSLRFPSLARLAIVKLGVDQFVPSIGIAGNVVVLRAMKRLGLPTVFATEALLIDILSHYVAYVVMTILTILTLWLYHDVTVMALVLVSVFLLTAAGVLIGMEWLMRHRTWKPPMWLLKYRSIPYALEVVASVSPERVRSPKLIGAASTFQSLIFVFDTATLWGIMHAIGSPVNPLTAFVGFVIASIAGTVSFLPGGIGGFEAGSVATLSLLGVPIQAALTGTLLLRGVTLWIPLIPAAVFTRREFRKTPN